MRTKKNSKAPSSTVKGTRIFDTLSQAASALGVDISLLKAAKKAGCVAFNHGRVHEEILLPWLEQNGAELSQASPRSLEGVRIAEGLEKIRERRRKNDVAEGRLVARAWIAERFNRLAGDANALRAKSEAEHAVALAGAGDDIPRNREVLKAVWDDIFRGLRDLGRHFSEEEHA